MPPAAPAAFSSSLRAGQLVRRRSRLSSDLVLRSRHLGPLLANKPIPGAQMRARLRPTNRKPDDQLGAVAVYVRIAHPRLHGPGHEARVHPGGRLAKRAAGAEKKEDERYRKQTDGGFRHGCSPFVGRPYSAKRPTSPDPKLDDVGNGPTLCIGSRRPRKDKGPFVACRSQRPVRGNPRLNH